jgi:hypothetical protein
MTEGGGQTAFNLINPNKNGLLINHARWVPSIGGLGISLDGTDDYIQANNVPTSDIVTASFRVIINKPENANFIFASQDGGTAGRLSFGWNHEEKMFIAKSGIAYHSIQSVSSSLISMNGKLKHVVFIYNPNAFISYCYIDGIMLDMSATSQTIISDTILYIGREGGLYSDGLIDGVHLYNRALRPEEIQWLYAEPYAMFEQPRRGKWFFVAAGGLSIPVAMANYRQRSV